MPRKPSTRIIIGQTQEPQPTNDATFVSNLATPKLPTLAAQPPAENPT